jgi:hypothetical protein
LISHHPSLLRYWLGDDDNLSVHVVSTCHELPVPIFPWQWLCLCFHETCGHINLRILFLESAF